MTHRACVVCVEGFMAQMRLKMCASRQGKAHAWQRRLGKLALEELPNMRQVQRAAVSCSQWTHGPRFLCSGVRPAFLSGKPLASDERRRVA